jgi:hypothetical protein
VNKYQDQGNLETTITKKRTRDAMKRLEQEVLEQHKRYGPETLTYTRRESGHLLSLSDSGLATHLNESYSLRRQEGGYTPSWLLGVPLTRRTWSGHWLFLLKQRTSVNKNSLLQTTTLDSLEACPERESVTMLAHRSDHSVKAFIPTLLVSYQRLTMLRQRTANNMVTNGTAEQLANKGTAALNKAASNRLVALNNSKEEERCRATKRAHATRLAFTTPTLAPSIPKKVCKVYFAPILDETSTHPPSLQL